MFAMQRWLLLGPFQRVRLITSEIELGSISQHWRCVPSRDTIAKLPFCKHRKSLLRSVAAWVRQCFGIYATARKGCCQTGLIENPDINDESYAMAGSICCKGRC